MTQVMVELFTVGIILMCVAFVTSIFDNLTPRTGSFIGVLLAMFVIGFVLVLVALDPLMRSLAK